eukprot:Gregarina_sp_Poly_1__9296@NODE_576_length_7467_cov_130_013649_g450_i0_p3_GENE_NODE_576_length_7467_cov_130_013649_g450_i0NODE_576_length_7467_cov_130_013649_g450_i0_p3_ORF_typecomplete_len437_score46_08MFS_1/PF07690_16/9_8e06MFS_1/PF07690_16/1_1e10MFS_2/PF13347_6/0_0024MFS_4/PF06779_14/2_8MFS_4/PF06779_14/2_7DUF3483/PF11982_8/0_21DUF3483/PF11982_8/1_2e03MFS_3/PF05977_13/0_61_NODE_576_length_7467_cov_130_013649_g450_i024573767
MGTLSDVRVARAATLVLMAVRGVLVGSWMAYVPAFKRSFDLDDGQLGLAILCSGAATMLMTVPVGRLIDLFGPVPVAAFTGILAPLLYAFLPIFAAMKYSPYFPLFIMSMCRAGGGIAYTSRAAEIERLWNRPLMSSFHAAFSGGTFAGSAVYACLLTIGVSGNRAFPVLCLAATVLAAAAVPFMSCGIAAPAIRSVSDPRPVVSPCSWTPSPMIICLGLLGALLQLVQGAIGDWGALYLHQFNHMPYSSASLGYSCFAFFMGAMRVVGDALCHNFGRPIIYRGGAVLMFVGLCVLLTTNKRILALTACSLVGAGCANMYPILMSCAGRHGLPTPGLAIATVSSLGITGLLAGPAIIGFIAQVFSLRIGMYILVLDAALVVVASSIVSDVESEGVFMSEDLTEKLRSSSFESACRASPLQAIDDCTECMALEGDTV